MPTRTPRLKARVALADADDRILCVLHAKPNQEPFWCLPGGNIDPDEPLVRGAARELLEEAGVTVAVDGALLIADGPHVDAVEVILRGRITSGSAALGDASGDAHLAEVAWHPRTALPASFRPTALRVLLESAPLGDLPVAPVADWAR